MEARRHPGSGDPAERDHRNKGGIMARRDETIIGLDIGTTKICVVVAEPTENGIDVVGIGTHPSRGLRKGVVIDIDATVDSIRKALDEAELMAGCEISSVYVGIAGGHIQARNEIGMVAIKDREVRAGDLTGSSNRRRRWRFRRMAGTSMSPVIWPTASSPSSAMPPPGRSPSSTR